VSSQWLNNLNTSVSEHGTRNTQPPDETEVERFLRERHNQRTAAREEGKKQRECQMQKPNWQAALREIGPRPARGAYVGRGLL
jgi:hypothetical protein